VNSDSATRTVVVGVGNLIRSDDGLGVQALECLQRDPRVPPDVTLLDGGTHGIELLVYTSHSSRLLLLDAVDIGQPPGTMVRLVNEELRGLPCGASVHQIGVADLLATLPLVSSGQRETVLLGVQPAATGWGTELSPAVQKALGPLVEAAIEQLRRWAQDLPAESAACAGHDAT
jgi:hydrogenase maturation protease